MMETFMYFWLNYSGGNNHIERIPVAVKNIDHLFHIASEILKYLHYICFYFLKGLEPIIINT